MRSLSIAGLRVAAPFTLALVVMKLKKSIRNIFVFLVWIYMNYQIYLALSTGIFDPLRGGQDTLSLDESPYSFVLYLGIAILFSIIILVFFFWSGVFCLNQQVRKYGANYNLNTLKAILKDISK